MVEINHLIFWGMFGLCFEVLFTSISDLYSKRNFNLMGHTSLWMFPIYSLGLTYGFDFVQSSVDIVSDLVEKHSNQEIRWVVINLFFTGLTNEQYICLT